MRTIAVLNQKGGVGKTTTVANTAAALAMKGLKVLVIDFDPQSHLTIHLGGDTDEIGRGSYEVLTQSGKVEELAAQIRDNLWLLGANIDLVGAESELVSVVGREIVLREALEVVHDKFDYVLIDCPPSLGLLTLNALVAVEEVFIPLQPHFLALQGLGKLLETVSLVSKRINPKLRITGVIFCMFDPRTTLSGEVKADIEKFLNHAKEIESPWSGARIIPIHVRRNIKLAEAPSYGKTIFEYESDCNGAADYMAIADYVHTRMGSGIQSLSQDSIETEEDKTIEQTEIDDVSTSTEEAFVESENVQAEVHVNPIRIQEVPAEKTESDIEAETIASNQAGENATP